jgi:hypothetical protein
MSASPPEKPEVEQGDPSPDTSDHNMDRGDPDAQARDLTFEFEVKEQDRWLPIANGWFSVHRQLPITVGLPQKRCSSIHVLRLVPLMSCLRRSHAAILLSTGLPLCNLEICTSIPPPLLSMVHVSSASGRSQICPAIPRNRFHLNVALEIVILMLIRMLTFVISHQWPV